MHQRFNARNANRPPDWRWERAKLAASGVLPMRRGRAEDDAWIHRAARFIQAFGEGDLGYPTSVDQAMIEERWPDIYWSHYYWRQSELAGNDGGHREAAARYGLEARVLAGGTPEEIREQTGMEPDDVRAYEALYFDVRDRLAQRQYVMLQVLGPAVHRGLNSRDYDLLWKLFGYYLGPNALDAIMYTFDGPRRKVGPEAVAESLAKSARDDLTRHAAIVGKTWRNDNISQGVILQVYQSAMQIERASGGAGAAGDALVANVAAALTAIPFVVGRAQARNPRLAALDGSGLEPSGRELVAYSMGEAMEPDPERLALTFPTPGSRGV